MARKQKQLGVGFTPEMRDALQKAADAAGHSVGEEIRQRVEQSFEDELYPSHLRRLLRAVTRFSNFTCERSDNWATEPDAARVLRAAIDAYLERRYGASEEPEGLDGISAKEWGRKIEADDHSVRQSFEEAIERIDKNLEAMRDALPQAGDPTQIEKAISELVEHRRRFLVLLGVPPKLPPA